MNPASLMTNRPARLALLGACALVTLTAMPGCVIGTLVGGMARSAERFGDHEVLAEYTGLQGKSFTVVTSADRVIEAGEPGLSARIMKRVNDRLMVAAGGSHGIPSRDLLAVLYNTPQWHAMPPGEVAEMLGVERLVWIELAEYRLTEPGNRHVWDGLARATVLVYAADSGIPDEPIYEKVVQVRFPDSPGYMEADIPGSAVTTELSNRLVNRAAWLFFDHREPNELAY
ncbi:MAG: hypothetical protein DHS20C14_04850 [Phycisphaeraceae bacterium]|nr:MAG: hypothetical protein DHS20C14_04850 [Phycisphaeraceae bacterium]